MADHNRHQIRLYKLPCETVRADRLNVPSYRESDEAGLFRRGYTKSHQADELQLKVMVAALDPLSLPVASVCGAGSVCDDDWYLPAIRQALRSIGSGGLLSVGDTKMGTTLVRSDLVRASDFYLCSLSAVGLAMQIVSIIQHTARTELAKIEEATTDVVPGNKGKKVLIPTAELWLRRLKGIACACVILPDKTKVVQLLNFHPTHLKILKILRCPDDLYSTYAKYCS